jgi:hypothetical protein
LLQTKIKLTGSPKKQYSCIPLPSSFLPQIKQQQQQQQQQVKQQVRKKCHVL